MANTILPWANYTEAVVGLNHPTLSDVDNRSLRAMLNRSGFGPDQVFRGLPVGNSAINAGSSDYTGTKEARITAAIADAVAASLPYCFVPRVASDGTVLLPYNASLVTFNTGVRMIREGGKPNVFDVKAYGAAGDNVSDDSFAFAAAIAGANAQGVGGGTVFVPIPPTNFRINVMVPMKSGILMEGEGPKSIIAIGANIGNAMFQTPSGTDSVVFRGLRMIGKSATFTNTSQMPIGVNADTGGATNIVIEDCEFDDWAGVGPSFLGLVGNHSSNIVIRRNKITNMGGHGVICQDYVDNVQVTDNYFKNWSLKVNDNSACTIGRNGINQVFSNNIIDGTTAAPGGSSQHCFSMDTSKGCTISGNVVRMGSATGFGIEVGFASQTTVTGNVVYVGSSANNSGIVVDTIVGNPTTDVTVTGNTVVGQAGGAHGIYLYGQGANHLTNIVVANNVVRATNLVGIAADYVVGLAITGNTIIGCVQSGIFISWTGSSIGDCNQVVITGNLVQGCNTSSAAGHGGIRADTPVAGTKQFVIENNNVNGTVSGAGTDYYITELGPSIIEAFLANVAQPSVAVGHVFRTQNTVDTTYSSFKDIRRNGETIFTIVCNDTHTIISNAVGNLRDGQDWRMPIGAAITLKWEQNNQVFREVSRRDPKDGTPLTVTEAVLVSGVDVSTGASNVTTLTAARVIGAPLNPIKGQRFVYTFIQDGTGGRAVTWNAVFKNAWSDTGNTLGKRSSIAHIYDGTNWSQDGAQSPYL